MRLIKIAEDHYIICDNSEIKEGDWYLCWESKSGVSTDCTIDNTFSHWIVGADNYKKITHSTQPLEDNARADGKTIKVYVQVKPFHLYEVKELIGVVDVEKMAEGVLISHPDFKAEGYSDYQNGRFNGIVEGYNKALEDNKERKYTEEDMRKMWKFGYNERNLDDSIEFFQHKTEWEVEFVDGKLKLKP